MFFDFKGILQHFEFENWRIRFLMSRTGHIYCGFSCDRDIHAGNYFHSIINFIIFIRLFDFGFDVCLDLWFDICFNFEFVLEFSFDMVDTGCSLSDQLILSPINQKYDDRFSSDLQRLEQMF